MIYNWQQPDWLNFKYDVQDIEDALFDFAEQTGHVSVLLKAMPEDIQMEAVIDLMVAAAIKTSEIEIKPVRILFRQFATITPDLS